MLTELGIQTQISPFFWLDFHNQNLNVRSQMFTGLIFWIWDFLILASVTSYSKGSRSWKQFRIKTVFKIENAINTGMNSFIKKKTEESTLKAAVSFQASLVWSQLQTLECPKNPNCAIDFSYFGIQAHISPWPQCWVLPLSDYTKAFHSGRLLQLNHLHFILLSKSRQSE